MKVSTLLLITAFAGEAVASWGFGKSAYNKWHETELERWLSDHNIPYPTPADRKDLEKIVHDNWQTKIVDSYQNWDAPQLQSYLSDTGRELDKKQQNDKNWLFEQVKAGWQETEKTAESAYGSMKDWVFDSWTESQLKDFLDRHGIPNPTPQIRNTLLTSARNNYQTVANKLGETASYPGNWLYESWSESDLKRWLDERGYSVPQPTSRDKLIAAVRRNSRLASIKAAEGAKSSKQTISDAVFDTWSDSELKKFLDKNNVNIPQGSTKNELLALARRNKAYLYGDTTYSSAASAGSSVTSVIGQKASSATDSASYYAQDAFDKAIGQWSDTRLKAYLDSRGVPVPQATKRDELLAKVRLNKHKAATGFGAWTFDTWNSDNLKHWLEARGQKISNDAAASRDKLYSSASAYYDTMSASAASAASQASVSAASAGGEATDVAESAASKATDSAASAASAGAEAVTDAPKKAYASVASALAQAVASVKDATFETWSDSDLKSYLDSYNIKTYQGTTRNEMIAMARRNAHYFRYGSQDQGIRGQFQSALGYVQGRISELLGTGTKAAEKAGDRVYESAQAAKDAAKEKATQAYDRSKEEL